MVVFLISLVGVPPLAGFVGKFLLFGAAIETGFTWLAVVAILNSVLSLAVYLRIVVPMYRTPKEAPTGGRAVATVWVVALVATVGSGSRLSGSWVAFIGCYPAHRSGLDNLDVDHHPRVLVLEDVAVEEVELLAFEAV